MLGIYFRLYFGLITVYLRNTTALLRGECKMHTSLKVLLLSGAATAFATSAVFAQDMPDDEDTVIAVGSQIRGSDIAGILPVTSLSIEDIEVTAAVSGDELLASIPQLGDVSFREGRFSGVNGARGDVGSINLRGVGTGNTLVLLNGRRLVLHPGTQAEDLVPVVSVNSNALPVTGIRRLEVLRDGASAVYGTDAVAGVVNTILDDNYDGLQVNLQYGTSEDTALDEISGTAKWGKNFNDGRSNISVFGNVMFRNGMPASDLRNSSTEDLRTFFVGTPFEGDTQLRNLSSQTQFGEFRSLEGRLDVFGDDDFHIQPNTLAGCRLDLGNGACADNGGSIDTSLRLDRARYRDIVGDNDRYNLFAFANHEFDNGMEFFGEASYYHADYSRRRESAAILSSNRFVLGGLRGNWGEWDWETAGLFSQAKTKDRTNRISNTLFQQAINRTDASAYNIFSGGNLGDTNAPRFANEQSTIDSFFVDVKRDGTTDLALIDAKISTPSLFNLPGGDVGVAIGAEWRNEGFEDDRDDRLDGTITFTDTVTGGTNLSDVLGSSPSPDTNGSRDVLSAFVEFAVPLVSEDMNIPLVHSFDVQLAARAESYSDVGDVIKPKIAASWHLFPQLSVRGSYSEGFRAPNLFPYL
jgi:outer membrane receptor protein involved in Fe transport